MDICNTLCRLCASENCSDIKLNSEIKLYIQKYLNLYIQSSDRSPQFVCKLCVNTLECFNSYALQCLQVQNFYSEILSKKDINKIEISDLKTEFRITNNNQFNSNNLPPIRKIKTILEENDNINSILNFDAIVKSENENNINDKASPEEEKRKRGRPRRNQTRAKKAQRDNQIQQESPENYDSDHFDTKNEFNPDEDRIENIYKKNKGENENQINEETQFTLYKCTTCKESFTKKSNLIEHAKQHTSKEKYPYICYHCGSQHSTEIKLKKHEIAHIPFEERQIYPCSHCEKRFMKPQAVEVHIKSVHLQERPFICHQCGRAFSSKGTLNEHLLIHSDITPFVCECGKSFKTIHRLKLHSDTHRDTQYECPVCFLQLNTKRTLRQHLVIHKEVRAYTCKICQKSFKRYKGLKTHEILHSGRRPYICPFCDRSFTNGSNCRSHKRRMHPKELAEYEKSLTQENEDNVNRNSEFKMIPSNISQDIKNSQDTILHNISLENLSENINIVSKYNEASIH